MDQVVLNGRYTLLERLGSGSQGSVFRAADSVVQGKNVALKVIDAARLGGEGAHSVRREFLLVSRLRHPGIVSVYDFDSIRRSTNPEFCGKYFFTMDLVEGEILPDEWDARSLAAVAHQLASALDVIHLNGLVHRDIKPQNILFTRQDIEDAETIVPIIIDFGFAAAVQTVAETTIRGTLAYLAPEIITGNAPSPRSDQYSLGVTMFELAAGRLPFSASSPVELARLHLEEPPPRLSELRSDIPEGLSAIVDRLLQKEPDERFPGMMEVSQALEAFLPRQLQKKMRVMLPNKLYGRESELERISELIEARITPRRDERSVPPGPPAVHITGEYGIGKTALLAEAVFTCNAKGIPVLRTEGGGGNSLKRVFTSFVHSLTAIIASTDEGAALAAELTLPLALAGAETEEEAEDTASVPLPEELMLMVFTALAGACAREYGLVITIDDVERLDAGVSAFLERCAPAFAEERIMFLTAGEVEKGDPRISGGPPVVIRLQGVGDEAVVRMSTDVLRFEGMEQNLLKVMRKEFNGSPFLLRESLQQFIERFGIIDKKKFNERFAEYLKGFSRGEPLRIVHGARLGRLDNASSNILKVLSIAHEGLPPAVINAFLPYSRERLTALLEQLQVQGYARYSRRGDWVYMPDEAFKRFVEARVESLRHSLHGHIADAMEEYHRAGNQVSSKELAYHMRQAGKREGALYWHERAAIDATKAGRLNEAINLLKECLVLRTDDKRLSRILEQLAECYTSAGDLANAERTYKMLLDGKDASVEDRTRWMLDLAKIYTHLGEFTRADAVLSEATREDVHEQFDTDIALQTIATLIARGDFAGTEQRALTLLRRVGDMRDEPKLNSVFNALGIAAFHLGRHEASLFCFYKALRILQTSGGRHDQIISTLNNIGNVYGAQFRFEKAAEYWKQALAAATKTGALRQMAQITNNLGIASYSRGMYVEAMKYYKEAETLFKRTGDLPGRTLVLLNVGEVHYALAEFHNALQQWVLCGRICAEIGDKEGMLDVSLKLAELFASVPDRESATGELARAATLISELGAENRRWEIHRLFGKLYLLLGEYENAIASFDEVLRVLPAEEDSKIASVYPLYLRALRMSGKKEGILKKIGTALGFIDRISSPADSAALLVELARIAGEIESAHLEKPIRYLRQALVLLEDQPVSETAMEACFETGEELERRGLREKSKELFTKSKIILDFIVSHIRDNSLEMKYLQHPGRKRIRTKATSLGIGGAGSLLP